MKCDTYCKNDLWKVYLYHFEKKKKYLISFVWSINLNVWDILQVLLTWSASHRSGVKYSNKEFKKKLSWNLNDVCLWRITDDIARLQQFKMFHFFHQRYAKLLMLRLWFVIGFDLELFYLWQLNRLK